MAEKQAEIGMRIREAQSAMIPRKTSAALARDLGVTPQAVNAWVNMPRDPKPEILAAIADALQVNLQWLATGIGPMKPIAGNVVREASATFQYIVRAVVPLWRGVLAADGFDGDCYFERDGEIELPAFFVGQDAVDDYWVVSVVGSSMAPRIQSGEKVVIRKSSDAIEKAITLLRSSDGTVYLKVLQLLPTPKATSINPIGQTFESLDGWQTLGHAVGIYGDPESGARNIEFAEGKPLKA